jgi:hypothetical protein
LLGPPPGQSVDLVLVLLKVGLTREPFVRVVLVVELAAEAAQLVTDATDERVVVIDGGVSTDARPLIYACARTRRTRDTGGIGRRSHSGLVHFGFRAMRTAPPPMASAVMAAMSQPVTSEPVAGKGCADVCDGDCGVDVDVAIAVDGSPQPLEVAELMSLFVELAHIMSFEGGTEGGDAEGVEEGVEGVVTLPGGELVLDVEVDVGADVDGAVVVEVVVDVVAPVVVVVGTQEPSVAPGCELRNW